MPTISGPRASTSRNGFPPGSPAGRFVVVAAVLGAIWLGCEPRPEFPASWNQDFSAEVSRELVRQKIRGCGQYEYKRHLTDAKRYLVRCTEDGENWVEHLIRVP